MYWIPGQQREATLHLNQSQAYALFRLPGSSKEPPPGTEAISVQIALMCGTTKYCQIQHGPLYFFFHTSFLNI